MADRDTKPEKLVPPPGCPDDAAPAPERGWKAPDQRNVRYRGRRR